MISMGLERHGARDRTTSFYRFQRLSRKLDFCFSYSFLHNFIPASNGLDSAKRNPTPLITRI